MADFLIKKNNEISGTSDKSLVVKEFVEKFSQKRLLIANSLTQVLAGISNIEEIISPEKIYIAKFPKDVLMKIDSGQYSVMKDKSGAILSTIIDTTLPKNRNIVHQLRMEEVNPNFSDKMKDLSSNVTNIAIQQQLAELAQMLVQIQTIVLEIKRGQMTDRIGLVFSGKNQLEQALQLNVTDPNRNGLIINSITTINTGRAQLDLALRDEIKRKIDIPENKFKLFLKSFFCSNFYKGIEEQYATIQDGMFAYFEATRLLTLAYSVIDSKDALQKVLEPASNIIEISQPRMKMLSALITEGDNRSDELWYDNPQKLLDKIRSTNQLELPKSIENVALEFSGRELLLEGPK